MRDIEQKQLRKLASTAGITLQRAKRIHMRFVADADRLGASDEESRLEEFKACLKHWRPVAEFASELGISRDTTKRHFLEQVFDRDWLLEPYLDADWKKENPRVGWYVRMNPATVSRARFLLKRFELYRRKPMAANELNDPSFLEDLAFKILGYRFSGSMQSASTFSESLDYTFSQKGCERVSQLMATLEDWGKCDSKQAMMLVLHAYLDIQFETGAYPSRRDLAEKLNFSLRSLYREPFGADCIKSAETYLKIIRGGEIAMQQLDGLAAQLGRDLEPADVQDEFFLPALEAEALVARWHAGDSPDEAGPTVEEEFGSTMVLRDFVSSGSVKNHSKRQNNSDSSIVKKRRADEKRYHGKREYLPEWKLEREGRNMTLFLDVLRRFEKEKIESFQENGVHVSLKHLKRWQGALRDGDAQERIGCLYKDGSRFVWRFLCGIRLEGENSSYHEALSEFLLHFDDLEFRDFRIVLKDRIGLRKEAPAEWPTEVGDE